MISKTFFAALVLAFGPLTTSCTPDPISSGGEPSPAPPVAQGQNPQLAEASQLLNGQKFAEAEGKLAEFVKANPQNGQGWYLLGLARHSQQKYDAALEAHLKAAEFPAFKASGLYNAACVYSLKNDVEKSIETLRAAVAAGFTDRSQLASDTDLENARKDKRFAELVPPLLKGKDAFVEPTTRVIHEFEGSAANSEFGWVARKVGDVDGDGVIDFVSTSPGYANHKGRADVYSSKTGKHLFTVQGKSPGNRFGNGAAGAGDVNKDGTPDVIIGGPSGEYALVVSGKDGSIIHTVTGTKGDELFGQKVCSLGDIDGDGHADFAVTAMQADGNETKSGVCFGFSGKDAKQLFVIKGERTGDKFGSSVAGNVDPAHRMIAVGAQDAGEGQKGRVYVYNLKGTEPQLAFVVEAKPSARNLGQMFVSFLGDVDKDGAPDVYCSDFTDSAFPGRVFIYSGANGKELLDVKGMAPGEALGTSVSDAGDANGDGSGDLIVGAWQNREGAISGGKVYLLSGTDGKVLATWTSKQGGDTLGFDATGIGDVDGDGNIDYLLTSAWSSANGTKSGRVFIVAGPKLK
jgi:hypothetical protein